MDEGAKAGLVLDNNEGDVHLTAESRKPHNELDRVDVASDGDELGLLLLDEGGDVLQAELNLEGGSSRGILLGGLGGSGLLGLLLARGGGEGAVGVEELENGGSLVLGEGLGKLVDHRGDLKALVEDGALALEAHVSGPLDKPTEVASLGADITTDPGGPGARRENGVLGDLGGALGRGLLGSRLLGGSHTILQRVGEVTDEKR